MSTRVEIVDPGIARILLPAPSAHAYLLFGRRLALIDCGGPEAGPALVAALRHLEVPRSAISLLILTHEHAGHAAGSVLFPDALVLAHPLAAAKLRHGDEQRTKLPGARSPDLELEHGSAIDLGGFSLQALHTPGHTSGSICLYDRERGLLITGDTALARSALLPPARSGSRGELLETLDRLRSLRVRLMLPAHGPISDDPLGDLTACVDAVRAELDGAALAQRVAAPR